MQDLRNRQTERERADRGGGGNFNLNRHIKDGEKPGMSVQVAVVFLVPILLR